MAAGVNDDEVENEVDEALDALIIAVDLDGLVRLVDQRCASRDWAGLLHLRNRSRWAVSTGRQLWPAATLAEYRLALLAPAEWAAQVLDEGSGRHSIGPLTEVIAQSHTWESLRPHLPVGPRAAFAALERALRGEVVERGDLPDVLEMPFALQPWEPQYQLAEYAENEATYDAPPRPTSLSFGFSSIANTGEVMDDENVDLAIRQLVDAWTAESNGQAEVVCVAGVATDAVAALGVCRVRLTPISAQLALAWLAWAGASGGAQGRRRGAALGRFGAWWVVAALGGELDSWPLHPDDAGALAEKLRWYWFDAGEPALGWELQLAVELPEEGLAWAISARDAA